MAVVAGDGGALACGVAAGVGCKCARLGKKKGLVKCDADFEVAWLLLLLLAGPWWVVLRLRLAASVCAAGLGTKAQSQQVQRSSVC